MTRLCTLLLLALTALIGQASAQLFRASLPDLVHNWLHFGANVHGSDSAPPAHHPHSEPDHAAPSPPSYVIGAAAANTTVTASTMYHLQMMHRPEIDLVSSYMSKKHVYLEYGAGGSTYNFGRLAKVAYSIEHSCRWAKYISDRMNVLGDQFSHIHVKCAQVKQRERGWGTLSNYEHANYFQFRPYVDAIESLPHQQFDRVFIDGRARLACALKVLPYLHNDSLVFIHDFFARIPHYSAVLRYYVEVSRVLARPNDDPKQGPLHEPQGLIVLRRSPNFTRALTTEEIDAIYDTIPWRYPHPDPLTSFWAYIKYWSQVADFGTWKRSRNGADLTELVRRDVLKLATIYAIVMLILTIWPMITGRKKRANRSPTSSSVASTAKSTSSTTSDRSAKATATRSASTSNMDVTEVRYVETEGMRAAKARRKRASSGGYGSTMV